MTDFVAGLESTGPSHALRDAIWAVALIQMIHIVGVAMVLSSAGMVSLRYVRAGGAADARETAARFLPWIWTGLSLLLLTGIAQIVAEPGRTLNGNPAFQAKMALLVAAAILTLVVSSGSDGDMRRWNRTRVLAGVGFFLWLAIAVAGRWIAYMQAG